MISETSLNHISFEMTNITGVTQEVGVLGNVLAQNAVYGREVDLRGQLVNKYENNHNTSQPVLNTTQMEVPSIVGAFSVCGVTIGIAAILFNLIFILALSGISDKDKPYYRFTKCLSFCDLLGSLSFILIINFPRGIVGSITHSKFAFLRALPYVFRSIPWMFFTGYLLTLTCLAINQYVAVCKPWRYNQLVTNKTVTCSLICVWIVSSLQV